MKPVKLPVRLLAAIIMTFQIYHAFAAQGDWQQGAKDAYVDRCSKSMLKNALRRAARACELDRIRNS